MFRIAHLGYFDALDMLTVLSAIEITLRELGHPLELGRGVGAAAEFFFRKE
jgi:aspartate aminotransferase-like enzyme